MLDYSKSCFWILKNIKIIQNFYFTIKCIFSSTCDPPGASCTPHLWQEALSDSFAGRRSRRKWGQTQTLETHICYTASQTLSFLQLQGQMADYIVRSIAGSVTMTIAIIGLYGAINENLVALIMVSTGRKRPWWILKMDDVSEAKRSGWPSGGWMQYCT